MRTRPAISWSDLAGARVGVWGLGVEGTANLHRLVELGADVVVVEDAPPPGEALRHPVLALASGGLEALASQDVVVKTPGVRRRRPEVAELEMRGIPVVGGLGLWMQEAPLDRVVVITGTKGKSTTTAICGHLLERLGYRCLVAGNIGRVPYEPTAPEDFDYAIVEVSSYQATDLAVSPPVVAVTSLHPDHLDWHGGVEEYFSDKLSACTQDGADLTIADGDSSLLVARATLLGPRVRWVRHDDPDLGGAWIDALGLPGAHNRRNAMIARACLRALGVPEATDAGALASAAEGFVALDSRLRTIGTVAGVSFVDDSLSTNVLPTLAALDTFAGQRVALIVGGHDRGIDYGPLAEAVATRGPDQLAVFTLPANGPRILARIREAIGPSPLEVRDCEDLDEAVRAGAAWAAAGPGSEVGGVAGAAGAGGAAEA
ncbi:MAG: UDP-N-acetylmuramoyl-L-alanine--D-glutamate ligase, partial [Acidimicrobiales bacterium]